MKKSDELFAEAKALDAKSDELKRQASEARQQELLQTPLADRLVYAAYERCPCGAGMAYDPCHEDKDSPFVGPLSGYWDCSSILLGSADQAVKHQARLPFAFYEIKSEGQPSANEPNHTPRQTVVSVRILSQHGNVIVPDFRRPAALDITVTLKTDTLYCDGTVMLVRTVGSIDGKHVFTTHMLGDLATGHTINL